jgi:hypothetical protein
MQLFLFRSDRRSFRLDVFSSPLLSPYRQPRIFRCKWSCGQIFDPANSWMYPNKVLTWLYPGKFLSRFADVIALCPGRWYFVSQSCYALVLIIYSLAAAERPPLASSPLGDKAMPTHQVSHLSSLVFRVECLAGCCHLVVEHIDYVLFAVGSGGLLDFP